MRRVRTLILAGLAMITLIGGTGCVNPLAFAPPIPVPVWVADRMEERIIHKNDYRTPIMPPIPPGHRPLCEDPPDLATILRAMPRVARGIPYIYEEFRDDYDYVVELMADHIDPPRFYPLIGPAQLHHCHYKCTVFYTETIESNYPFPFQAKRRRSEVIYIDRDHLHMVAATPDARAYIARDLNGPVP